MTSIEPPTPNLPLLRKVLDHIDAHPEEWTQRYYAVRWDDEERTEISTELGRTICGTTYCIAGHAVAMSEGVVFDEDGDGVPASGDDWVPAGARALGLNQDEAASLFAWSNSRAVVQFYAEQIAERGGERL